MCCCVGCNTYVVAIHFFTCMPTRVPTHTPTHVYPPTYTHTHVSTHLHPHTCIHTYTHTHVPTLTPTHMYPPTYTPPPPHRYSNYQQSVAALHDVVLQVLAQRRKDGVQDSDRDLLSYMLRAQEQQKQTQPNTQQYGEGADDDVLVLTDEDLVYELQGVWVGKHRPYQGATTCVQRTCVCRTYVYVVHAHTTHYNHKWTTTHIVLVPPHTPTQHRFSVCRCRHHCRHIVLPHAWHGPATRHPTTRLAGSTPHPQ